MARPTDLPPIPQISLIPQHSEIYRRWLGDVAQRIQSGPFKIPVYNVADLAGKLAADQHGDGSTWTAIIGVADETGGFCLAFSDGSNWKRAHDISTTIS